jgi:hypothetical protein
VTHGATGLDAVGFYNPAISDFQLLLHPDGNVELARTLTFRGGLTYASITYDATGWTNGSSIGFVQNAPAISIWAPYDTRNSGQGLLLSPTYVGLRCGNFELVFNSEGYASLPKSLQLPNGQGLFWSASGTPSWNLGADGGQFYIWDDLNNFYMMQIDITTGNVNFKGPVFAAGGIVQATSAERNTQIGQSNSAGWPGVKFYWGGVYERNMVMDGSGNILYFNGNDATSGNTMKITPGGSVPAIQFVATATP